MRSYGLVNELRKNKIPVGWVIKNQKQKDGADISVRCTGILPATRVPTTSAVRNFPAGPFIVAPQYETRVRTIIAALPTAGGFVAGWNVAVYKTDVVTTVNIRHILDHKLFVALSNVDNSPTTHSIIFDAAGYIEGVDWQLVESADILAIGDPGSCFTTLTEPHFDNTNPVTYTTPVRAYLEAGGNMLAQCAGIGVYETAHFLTTTGFNLATDDELLQYPNPTVPFGQFEGKLDETQGGSINTFRINPTGRILNDGFLVSQSIF